ncbi:MAG: hypothetical protein WC441_02545 [Patescibacteria group bacterium]
MKNGKKSVVDSGKLTDEQLGKLNRKFREIEKRLHKGVLDFSEVLNVLQYVIIEDKSARCLSFVNDPSKIEHPKHLIDTDAAPLIPIDGWSVRSHIGHGLWAWDPSLLELFYSKKQEKNLSEDGDELREIIGKIKRKIVLNANVLDYLLEHRELIPESWKMGRVLFWGTIYRSEGNGLCVRYLSYGLAGWTASFEWITGTIAYSSPAALGKRA